MKKIDINLNSVELQKIYDILKWYNIATSGGQEEKRAIEKILFKLRRVKKNECLRLDPVEIVVDHD